MTDFDDYSIIAENDIEWYSSRRGCTHAYGLLIRTLEGAALEEIKKYCEL